jgi:signal transduction histidine kinase
LETVSREQIYSIIAEELGNDHYIQDLRQKALAIAEGDPSKAQEVYVEYRLKQLEEKIRESEKSIRSLRETWKRETEQRIQEAHRIKLKERGVLRTDWNQSDEFERRKASKWVLIAPAVFVSFVIIYGLMNF